MPFRVFRCLHKISRFHSEDSGGEGRRLVGMGSMHHGMGLGGLGRWVKGGHV